MVNTRLDDSAIRPVGTINSFTELGTLFVCGYSTGNLFRSYDNGATWDSGTFLPNVHGICELANGNILAVGDSGVLGSVYKSTDRGATWDAGVVVGGNIVSITQLANGSVVMVSRASDKLFTSTDEGATWDAGVAVGGVFLQQVIQLANGDVVVTALTSGKIYKSADNGATWDAGVTVGASLRGVCQLANGDLLCTASSKVYRSLDNGATWDTGTSVTGLTGRLYYSSGFVYASSQVAGTYRSADDGLTWVAMGTPASTTTGEFILLPNTNRLVTVPTGASGVVLQSTCTTGDNYWRTDNAQEGGFRLVSCGKPTILRFDPAQTKELYLSGVFGGTTKYMFIA